VPGRASELCTCGVFVNRGFEFNEIPPVAEFVTDARLAADFFRDCGLPYSSVTEDQNGPRRFGDQAANLFDFGRAANAGSSRAND
jgi:hypothetical protein